MDRTPSRHAAGKRLATVPASGRTGIDVPVPVSPSDWYRADGDRLTSMTEILRHLLRLRFPLVTELKPGNPQGNNRPETPRPQILSSRARCLE